MLISIPSGQTVGIAWSPRTARIGNTMGQLEDILGRSGFYRCYQSFIVNLSRVSAVHVDSGTKYYALCFRNYEGEIPLSHLQILHFLLQ